jgi:4-oxalocrotonate tautomerase
MPHVIVKLFPGRSEQQKSRLADAIVRNVVEVLNSSEDSVSVSVEDVPSEQWAAQVYEPDIQAKWEQLYKKPGYKV